MMLQALMGASTGSPVFVSNQTLTANDSVVLPGTATASATYLLQSTGVARRELFEFGTLVGTDISGEWLVSGVASDFEARFTVQSGSFNTGVFGSWLALSTTRTIGNTSSRDTSGTTTNTGSALVEIRRIGFTDVLASATITCEAVASAGS